MPIGDYFYPLREGDMEFSPAKKCGFARGKEFCFFWKGDEVMVI